jgi:starch phosphorylase
VQQVTELRLRGYRPRDYYEQNSILREVLDLIGSGALSNGDKALFQPIVDNLLEHDPFFLLADYQSYVDCQSHVSALWGDDQNWTRKSILNVARMGKFSADRSIDDYSQWIWKVKPVHVHVG